MWGSGGGWSEERKIFARVLLMMITLSGAAVAAPCGGLLV